MADVQYCDLDLTGKDIKERLEKVVTLEGDIDKIGTYDENGIKSDGYLGKLQEKIKTVENTVNSLKGSDLTNLTNQVKELKGEVEKQTPKIEQNESNIASLKAKTIGDKQPPNTPSLQDQIIDKVSKSDFGNFQNDIEGQLDKIESKNSEQDNTLTAIGRIADEKTGREGSGDLGTLQKIIKTYGDINDIRNDITNLSTDLITLSERVRVLENQILNR